MPRKATRSPALLSMEARNSIGETTTFQYAAGVQKAFPFTVPSDPATPNQVAVRTAFGKCAGVAKEALVDSASKRSYARLRSATLSAPNPISSACALAWQHNSQTNKIWMVKRAVFDSGGNLLFLPVVVAGQSLAMAPDVTILVGYSESFTNVESYFSAIETTPFGYAWKLESFNFPTFYNPVFISLWSVKNEKYPLDRIPVSGLYRFS